MTSELDYFTYRYPRKSSDYPLVAISDRTPARLYLVADMVGRPRGLEWRNYCRTMEQQIREQLNRETMGSLSEFADKVSGQLQWHSDFISRTRRDRDQSAFGFCMSGAAVWEHRARILRVGDCRAYHLRRTMPGQPASARCLTRDQNALGERIESAPHRLTSPEIAELSHQLGCFLGMHESQRVAATLSEVVEVDLDRGDCLLLTTDGFHMPQVRNLAGHQSMMLSSDEFYLNRWMTVHLAAACEAIPSHERNFWPEVGEWLLEETHRASAYHRRYRDDIALIGVYRT